jgi:hypothetical protein
MSADDDDTADRDFEQRARADLRRSVEQTSPETRARLDAIVERALQSSRSPAERAGVLRFAIPAGAVAVLAGLLIIGRRHEPAATMSPATEDLALLIDGDNLDLLEQMEFYQWLDRQPEVLDEALAASESAQRS